MSKRYNVTILTVHGSVSAIIESPNGAAVTARKLAEAAGVKVGRVIDRKGFARAVSTVMSSDPAWFNIEVSPA